MNIPLLTDEQRRELIANADAVARGVPRGDVYPVVKLYTPDARASWLLTELDPTDGDTAFGLCDVGLGTPELGHVKLSVLESIRGPANLPVARDPQFRPARRLSDYAALSLADGSIND